MFSKSLQSWLPSLHRPSQAKSFGSGCVGGVGHGRGPVGIGAAIAVALEAAVLGIGIVNRTLGGYLLFGIGVVTIVIFMTAYYAWRARRIAKSWWGRAQAENDPSRSRP